jgi:hypothetical protein
MKVSIYGCSRMKLLYLYPLCSTVSCFDQISNFCPWSAEHELPSLILCGGRGIVSTWAKSNVQWVAPTRQQTPDLYCIVWNKSYFQKWIFLNFSWRLFLNDRNWVKIGFCPKIWVVSSITNSTIIPGTHIFMNDQIASDGKTTRRGFQ